ncbi:MAG: hypothetical protein J6T35_01450 [Bacteroidales bacterium]|nr:hypothetical protein [Bacteroidales bacterium]
MKVRAYLKETQGGLVVYSRRDKYKHAYRVGAHAETDKAFFAALRAGEVEWCPKVWAAQLRLFSK